MWGMLGLMSRLSARGLARQTLAIFSTHDPDEGLSQLSAEDMEKICRFYQGRSSRKGALNDATHTVGEDVLAAVCQPALVIHSRKDHAVPFNHAEWSLAHIPPPRAMRVWDHRSLFLGWSDYSHICKRLIAFLKAESG
jgi:pimeloyl-ACP methyl ester carboxylesterase